MNSRNDRDIELAPEDRGWVDEIARRFRPKTMDAAEQIVFRRRLEERLALRSHTPWGAAGVMVAAAAAVLLWVAVPRAPEPRPVEVAEERERASEGAETSVLYAVLGSDRNGTESVSHEEYLPDEYVVLAGIFDLGSEDR